MFLEDKLLKSNFTPDEFIGICKKVADKNSRMPDSYGKE
jgi:hypothetical protein